MNALMRVVAGGGGSVEEEAAVLSRFAAMVPAHGRVLNIPWAQEDPANASSLEWASSTLRTLGIADVRALSTVRNASADLDSADAVFLGGGNTFLLLYRLRETGLAAQMVERIRAGMACYGGSAGAIVLGSHIGTAAAADPNDVGLSDLRGLDLLNGFALWCHYRCDDDPLITQFVTEAKVSVISLSENSGIGFDGREIVAMGPGAVKLWRRGSAAETIGVHLVGG